MYTKALALAALVSFADARFGQEHPAAITEIAAVTSAGQPGQAATIAGGAISDLLAAANPCAKLETGDNIIASLGMGADAVKAAQDFVAAEQNFNPFNQDIPSICSDPTLPTTVALRGITPLIDPAVGGSDLANQLSAESLASPFEATGLSVADVLAAQGFTNFTTKDLAGNVGSPSGGSATASDTTGAAAATSSASSVVSECTAPTSNATTSTSNTAPSALNTTAVATTSTDAASASDAAASNSTAAGSVSASSAAGVDFGLCTPTMKFEGGLGGRPATEFTFQAIDPKISAIQEEALNPNIITNRICDELTNQCQSNQAAKDLCTQVKAQILALGTRDVTTANAWNSGLGFAGTNTDPDGPAQ